MKMDKNNCFLFSILIFALGLRIAAFFSLKDTIYYKFLLYDEIVYHQWAIKIAQGDHPSFVIHDFAPLYAWIMGGIYTLLSPDYFYIRIFNIVLGLMTCFAIYLSGKELKNRRVGLLAILIAAIYNPFIFFNILIHKTSLSIFLFSFLIWLFVSLMKQDSIIKAIFLGVCTGLLINVRSNAIVIIPVIIFFILKRMYTDKRPVKKMGTVFLMFFIGNLVALSPFGIINYTLTEKISVMPTSGFNLYIGNNTINSEPYYRPMPFAVSIPSLQAKQFVIEASRRTGEKLDAKQASSFWTNKVITIVTQSPEKFVLKIIRKILALFNRAETADNHHIDFLSQFIKFFNSPLPGIWLIMPFGLASLIFFIPSSKVIKALFFVWCAYALTLVLFFTNVRIRLPLMTILIPVTAFGIDALYSMVKRKKKIQISIFICIALFFYLLAIVPVKGADDITGHLNTHARALISSGELKDATAYWEKSSNMERSYSGYANLSLAGIYKKNEDFKKAHIYLNKIKCSSFIAAHKFDLQGDVLRLERKYDKAAQAYIRSLEINYGQRKVWEKLILLKKKENKRDAYKLYQKYKYVSSFYEN
ncbi:MAG: tetratricopeptide repeat protein [Desulfobacteraceae bacterium]|nr:tetratricopeptide repeat protein [Desulfobacteraceae bacterium]